MPKQGNYEKSYIVHSAGIKASQPGIIGTDRQNACLTKSLQLVGGPVVRVVDWLKRVWASFKKF